MMLAYCNSSYIFPGVIIPRANISSVMNSRSLFLMFALIDCLFYYIVFLAPVHYCVGLIVNEYHKIIKKFTWKNYRSRLSPPVFLNEWCITSGASSFWRTIKRWAWKLRLMSIETFGTEEITEKTRREETPGIILLLHRECRLSIKFETEWGITSGRTRRANPYSANCQ